MRESETHKRSDVETTKSPQKKDERESNDRAPLTTVRIQPVALSSAMEGRDVHALALKGQLAPAYISSISMERKREKGRDLWLSLYGLLLSLRLTYALSS